MKRIMRPCLAISLLSILINAFRIEWCRAADTPVRLAAYQAWFPQPSQQSNNHLPVYNSQDPAVIAKQIDNAKAMSITGFVVDWYGPSQTGLVNDTDRKFIDEATAVLFAQAEAKSFKVALMYDEGTVKGIADPTAQALTDLIYAKKYFSSSAYLQMNGHPAVFVFPYDEVDQYINWNTVRSGLGTQITLIDKEVKPDTFLTHDTFFDGFYPWVQSTWSANGKDWGEEYLKQWFYLPMKGENYANKIMVGGVWPGFDDSLAFWGKTPYRFISRQDGQVYQKTWDIALAELAKQNNPPFILIETWNDFEEGTDIEFGVDMTVNMENTDPSYPVLLVRSSPFRVEWNPNRGVLTLQVYKKIKEQPEEWDSVPIFDQKRSSGSYLTLESGSEYAVKLWTSENAADCIIKKVKIRSQDPKPMAGPLPAVRFLLERRKN